MKTTLPENNVLRERAMRGYFVLEKAFLLLECYPKVDNQAPGHPEEADPFNSAFNHFMREIRPVMSMTPPGRFRWRQVQHLARKPLCITAGIARASRSCGGKGTESSAG